MSSTQFSVKSAFPTAVRWLKWAGDKDECCTEIIDTLIEQLNQLGVGCAHEHAKEYKRAVVFLTLLKSIPQEDVEKVNAMTKTLPDMCMVLILAVLTGQLDLQVVMEQVEDTMQSGECTEGVYLSEMDALKEMYAIKEKLGEVFGVIFTPA